jgi:adenylate cyclase class 2
MLEIEKKYRLTESRRDSIVTALRELGATFERDETEENTIYGGETLGAPGAIIRIRKTEHRSLLTYKRRIEDGSDVKQQVEYETEVSDADAADKIIRELQLTPRIVYEKRRSTWQFRGVEVVFDELPFGLFMEIEGSRTEIKEAELLLGIEDLETEHETYPRLTARMGTQVGGVVESRF